MSRTVWIAVGTLVATAHFASCRKDGGDDDPARVAEQTATVDEGAEALGGPAPESVEPASRAVAKQRAGDKGVSGADAAPESAQRPLTLRPDSPSAAAARLGGAFSTPDWKALATLQKTFEDGRTGYSQARGSAGAVAAIAECFELLESVRDAAAKKRFRDVTADARRGLEVAAGLASRGHEQAAFYGEAADLASGIKNFRAAASHLTEQRKGLWVAGFGTVLWKVFGELYALGRQAAPSGGQSDAARASADRGRLALEKELKATDWVVRRAAVFALGRLAALDPESAAAVVSALRDAEPRVRRAAARTLGTLGPKAAPGVRALLEIWRPGVYASPARPSSAGTAPGRWLTALAGQVLWQLGGDVAPRLGELLADDDWGVRTRAATLLRRLRKDGNGAVAALLELVRSGPPDRRLAALEVLSAVASGEATAVSVALRAVRSADARTRRAALTVLGTIGAPARGAVSVLAKAVPTPKKKRRRGVAPLTIAQVGPALGRIGGPEALQALKGWVMTARGPDRSAALVGLRLMGTEARAALPQLGEALADESEDVRRMAIMALHVLDPEATGVIPLFRKALGKSSSTGTSPLPGVTTHS